MSLDSDTSIQLTEIDVASYTTSSTIVPYSITSLSPPSTSIGLVPEPEEMKKLSVMVPKSLHKQLRLFSASSDLTITDLVVTALSNFLKGQ